MTILGLAWNQKNNTHSFAIRALKVGIFFCSETHGNCCSGGGQTHTQSRIGGTKRPSIKILGLRIHLQAKSEFSPTFLLLWRFGRFLFTLFRCGFLFGRSFLFGSFGFALRCRLLRCCRGRTHTSFAKGQPWKNPPMLFNDDSVVLLKVEIPWFTLGCWLNATCQAGSFDRPRR